MKDIGRPEPSRVKDKRSRSARILEHFCVGWSSSDETLVDDHIPPLKTENLKPTWTKPRLPLAICERILDACRTRTVFRSQLAIQSATLRACALTCSRWYPRSRANLYKAVWIQDARQAALFTRTLRAEPGLAGFIEELFLGRIDGGNPGPSVQGYVPFAEIMPLLRAAPVRFLHIDLDWDSYPPDDVVYPFDVRAGLGLSQLDRVTTLDLTGHGLLRRPLGLEDFEVLWALGSLRACALPAWIKRGDEERIACALAGRMGQGGDVCPQLRVLRVYVNLDDDGRRRWESFAPPGAFGEHVHHVAVYLNGVPDCRPDGTGTGLETLANCITDFRSLKKLSVGYRFGSTDMTTLSYALAVLVKGVHRGRNRLISRQTGPGDEFSSPCEWALLLNIDFEACIWEDDFETLRSDVLRRALAKRLDTLRRVDFVVCTRRHSAYIDQTEQHRSFALWLPGLAPILYIEVIRRSPRYPALVLHAETTSFTVVDWTPDMRWRILLYLRKLSPVELQPLPTWVLARGGPTAKSRRERPALERSR